MASAVEVPRQPGEIRTWTDFVIHVENTLGWLPDARQPLWKARQIEVSKLKRKIAQDPKLYTLDNLLATVEWLRRRRQPVRSPAGVCWQVEQALHELPHRHVADPVDERITAAVETERTYPRPEGQLWIKWLHRAQGDARELVLAEWEASRETAA